MLEGKISLILDYYIRHQMYGIQSYTYQQDDYSGGEEGNISVEINFYPDPFFPVHRSSRTSGNR